MTSLKGNAADPAEKSHSQEVFLILGSISLLLVVIGLFIYFAHIKFFGKVTKTEGKGKLRRRKTKRINTYCVAKKMFKKPFPYMKKFL